jgi:hypothetical protein
MIKNDIVQLPRVIAVHAIAVTALIIQMECVR